MVDAEKLNDTIEELENEVENIKNISQLVKDIEDVSIKILINNEAYENIVNDLEISKNNLKDINDTLEVNIQKIQDENMSFNKKISKNYSELENQLLTQLQGVKIETKKLYLEIDESLKSRLDKNKSDIELEIRNNTEEISTQLKNENLDKKLKKHEILLYAAIGIGLINLFVKLFI
jgi:intracellular sulfur oxidation DsrE/DsrF family protein